MPSVAGAPEILPLAAGIGQVVAVLAIILGVSRLFGHACTFLRQPAVIGEILAGIALGPSLLGWVAPTTFAQLFPTQVLQQIQLIAQVSVVLFLFLVGLEFDATALRRIGRSAIVIAAAGILVPFLLGAAFGLAMYPVVSETSVPMVSFGVFTGVAMAITAFPVLARILRARRLSGSHLGVLALASASVGDGAAWCVLALIVSSVQSHFVDGLVTTLMTVAYTGFLFLVARPRLSALIRRCEQRGGLQVPVGLGLLAGAGLSATITNAIGAHALFGAFLFGMIVPHESRIAATLREKLESIIIFLLPSFFAITGMRTEIGLLATPMQWALCALIFAIACLGKFGGTLAAARFVGMGWREAAALGVLMNTRGLMELVVLNIGLDLKIISPPLFVMFVLMALATTVMAGPALDLLMPTLATQRGGPAEVKQGGTHANLMRVS